MDIIFYIFPKWNFIWKDYVAYIESWNLLNFQLKYIQIFYTRFFFSWTTCNLFSSTQMIHELEGSNLMLLCFFVYFPSSPKQCESLNHQTGCLDVALLWSNKKYCYMFVCFLHFETHNIFNTYALLYMNDPSWKTSTSTWVEKMLTAFYIKILRYLECFNARNVVICCNMMYAK